MAKSPPTPIRDLAFAVKCLAEARRETNALGRTGLTEAQRLVAVEVIDLALTQLRERLQPLDGTA